MKKHRPLQKSRCGLNKFQSTHLITKRMESLSFSNSKISSNAFLFLELSARYFFLFALEYKLLKLFHEMISLKLEFENIFNKLKGKYLDSIHRFLYWKHFLTLFLMAIFHVFSRLVNYNSQDLNRHRVYLIWVLLF